LILSPRDIADRRRVILKWVFAGGWKISGADGVVSVSGDTGVGLELDVAVVNVWRTSKCEVGRSIDRRERASAIFWVNC